jgi:hypothetical protein
MFRAAFLPEICRVVIPIKLEFSASVGFIHKESMYLPLEIHIFIYIYIYIKQAIIKFNHHKSIIKEKYCSTPFQFQCLCEVSLITLTYLYAEYENSTYSDASYPDPLGPWSKRFLIVVVLQPLVT